MNKGGFSWNRFLGISAMKSRVSRKIGIPLTRSGRHQKIGRVVSGGCMLVLLLGSTSFLVLLFLLVKLMIN